MMKSSCADTTIAEMIKAQTDEDDFRELIQTEQEFLNCVGTNKINPYLEECIMKQDPLEKVPVSQPFLVETISAS